MRRSARCARSGRPRAPGRRGRRPAGRDRGRRAGVDASSQGPDYFIVVPVLDEVVALPTLLDELRGLGLLDRTLFVDNSSSDGSPGLIAAAGATLLREARRGYGYPCLAGARAAAARGARAVVFMEADGTDDPAQVRHLVGPIPVSYTHLTLPTIYSV